MKQLASERVLILGASGWFGRTLHNLLPTETPVLRVASRSSGPIRSWNRSDLNQFSPTVVVNCAFLTPDKMPSMGEELFRLKNLTLLESFAAAASLPSVRYVIDISSGAAAVPRQSVYGELKRHQEWRTSQLAAPNRNVIIIRPYSVSGPFVRDPHLYAFSSLILHAKNGHIPVRSASPTYRRYTSVTDLFLVALMLSFTEKLRVLESGGELVEVGYLASKIASVVNPSASISRPHLSPGEIDYYASSNVSWSTACAETGLHALSLEEQIVETAASPNFDPSIEDEAE